MAISNDQIVSTANAIKSLANAAKSLKSLTDQTLEYNSSISIDWGSIPDGLLDTNGKIIGVGVAPADVSNVIGSLAAYQTLWAGGHGGNFEKLATPIV